MSENHPYALHGSPSLDSSSLIVGWSEDAGRLGPKVTDHLVAKLGGRMFGEIEPAGFFPLGGVSVDRDVAQFPESKFYTCPEKRLAVLRSDPPGSEWHRFLSSVLDVAEHHCNATELYTVGAMVYFGPHTAPRQLVAVANSPEMKAVLGRYGLARDIDYETPPGQRPTVSSFLLWIAGKRNIPAASLWVPVPYYLVSVDDPPAWRKVLEFLGERFGLDIDLGDIDELGASLDSRLGDLRACSPEIDGYIQRLESNLALSQEESEKLVKEVEDFLGGSD